MADTPEHTLRRVAMTLNVMALVPVVVLGVLGALLGAWWLGALVGLSLAAALVLRVRRGSDAAVLRSIGAQPASEVSYRRYHNLVDGLCVTTGVAKPELWVIDDPAANALALGRTPSEARIAVTTGLLDRLERIELEGVLATLLGQIRSGDTGVFGAVRSLAATVAPLGESAARVVERFLSPERVTRSDVAGCRITRFPPGLIAALERLSVVPTQPVLSPAAVAPLWLIPVGPATDVPTLDERISMLREL